MTIIEQMAEELFRYFKFEAGIDNELRISTAASAWNIPWKQRVDSGSGEWVIYCPYLDNGGYTNLIELVKHRIENNFEFFKQALIQKRNENANNN